MANKGTGIFKYLRGDKGIWTIMMILTFVSIAAVYSSTGRLAYLKQGGDTTYYMLKHLGILVVAWGIMYGVHRVRYTYFSRFAQLMVLPVLALLMITLTMATVNDAARWIKLGPLSFQPSELAKLVIVVFLARQLTKYQPVIKEGRTLLRLLWVPLLGAALIFPENLSTAALLLLTCFVMMIVGGVASRYIWSMLGAGVLFVALFLSVLYFVPAENLPGRFSTWKARVERFGSEEDESYQVTQSKIAIAGGGVFGKGPGNSTQRNFLPHPYSDYIYSLIIEEYGMFAGIGVMLLYLWFLMRGISIARRCRGSFGSYMVLGITFMLTLQALINMGVAVDLLPVTGQPLPFLSMGGTSLFFTACGMGVILSVSADVEKTELEENKREK
ncbi:MAG: FtsW/RodA/SpoVE family cell cycle protein [Bacteroides sp.]|nr:FtsW/RodA/SpoVE family cell cycle protein [Bacteroides sp.]MCM1086318.1 FtsW/RodA/SpoVE family cell cycle protein [Bacteroides sp.]